MLFLATKQSYLILYKNILQTLAYIIVNYFIKIISINFSFTHRKKEKEKRKKLKKKGVKDIPKIINKYSLFI